jgi:hypothetical protein
LQKIHQHLQGSLHTTHRFFVYLVNKSAFKYLKQRHMNSPEIKKYIREHSNLFWYIPEDKKEEISTEFLVETILNYGDKDEVIQLFDLMGINKVAHLFFDSINLSDRRKGNYHEITVNYFTLVFNKYAQRNN